MKSYIVSVDRQIYSVSYDLDSAFNMFFKAKKESVNSCVSILIKNGYYEIAFSEEEYE